jgi:hypothetical protein
MWLQNVRANCRVVTENTLYRGTAKQAQRTPGQIPLETEPPSTQTEYIGSHEENYRTADVEAAEAADSPALVPAAGHKKKEKRNDNNATRFEL